MKKAILSIIFGIFIAFTMHLLIKNEIYSDENVDCPFNASCVGAPSSYVSGWPFVSSEIINDYRNMTDDFKKGLDYSVILSKQTTIDDAHFVKLADVNEVFQVGGFIINSIFYATITYGLIQLKFRLKKK